MTEPPRGSSRLDLFRNPGFPAYVAVLFLTGFAVQIQTVAVGWRVYDMTRDPFQLGLVGLSQFLPALLLVFPAGAVADRLPRRLVMSVCLAAMSLTAAAFAWLTLTPETGTPAIFGVVVLFGIARAFYNPARQSIVPNLVPRAQLHRALATNNIANQVATMGGPVAGGLLYGLAPQAAHLVSFASFLAGAVLVLSLPRLPKAVRGTARGMEEMAAGLRYILRTKIVLGALSLDLFVVLLGGVIALLPVYARDVLDVGSVGLGILRAAPAIGAVVVAGFLVGHPITRHAGHLMFACVAGFALATLVFAVSTTVWLSILCLMLIGGFDTVSVIIRGTLIQLHTPDELRGRVTAVNQIFIGTSNEVGGFRAGTTAALVGPMPAVAGGALAALGVCALWYRLFPDLRRASSLHD